MARKPTRPATAHDSVGGGAGPRGGQVPAAPDHRIAAVLDDLAAAFRQLNADLAATFQRIITDLQAVDDRLLEAPS